MAFVSANASQIPPAQDITQAVERLAAHVKTKFRKLTLISPVQNFTLYDSNVDLLYEASSILPQAPIIALANYFSNVAFHDAVVSVKVGGDIDKTNTGVPFFLEWESGVWDSGTWIGGIWNTGLWHTGVWLTGVWKSGKHEQGIWHTGVWEDGEWLDGVWYNGFWKNGVWYNGIWCTGVWFDGRWVNGTWKGGTIHNMQIDKLVDPRSKGLES